MLPLAAIASQKLVTQSRARLAAVTGGVALAGGLAVLGLIPDVSAWWAGLALAACGIGLGQLGGLLGPAAVPPMHTSVRAATASIGARHAGFVIGLAVIAPLLAGNLDDGTREATRATTAVVLDSTISLRQKTDLALELRNLVAEVPRGEVPDVRGTFDEVGDGDDEVEATGTAVTNTLRDALTRSFRTSFLVAAVLAVAAAALAAFVPGRSVPGRSVLPDRSIPTAVFAAIGAAVVVLVLGTFVAGAVDFGTREYVAPCEAPDDPFPQGSGLDGTLQRIALSAINGAACELGTGREELLLSIEPTSSYAEEVTWTQEALEDALHAGLLRAIDDADERNTIPGFVASALRFAAERTPIDWILGRVDVPFLEE